MIRSLQCLFLVGMVAGLFASKAAAAQPSQVPFYFESHGNSFLASGPGAQCVISPAGAALTLQDGKSAPTTVQLQFAGACSNATFHGEAEEVGKINHLIGNQSAQWLVSQSAFARVQANEIYPGVSAVFYGNARRLEYDLTVAPGANADAIGLQFRGADNISVAADGSLLLTVAGHEISQPAPVIYQTIQGIRQQITGNYRLRDSQTVAFAVGNYDHSQPLVIDPFLSYSTYFGGNNTDTPLSLAVDSQGNIYMAGRTLSTKFTNNIPQGGFQTNFQGGSVSGDGFVAKFDATGSNLVYFTYIGGSSDDGVECLALDAAGDAYLAGFTLSGNFPTNNCFAPLTNKISGSIVSGTGTYPADAFVAELASSGSNLLYSGFLGGNQEDDAISIALDTNNASGTIAYVAGYTYSTNFPTSPNALSTKLRAPYSIYYNANAFIAAIGPAYATAFNPNAFYSSYLGGTNFDTAMSVAVDPSGYVYVTGFTGSTNFPILNAMVLTNVTPTNEVYLVTNAVSTNYFVGTNYVTGTNYVKSHETNTVLLTNIVNYARLNGSTNTSYAYNYYPYDSFLMKFSPGCTGLIYSTFLGGTNYDEGNSIAVDGAGKVYLTGWTASPNFPDTVTGITITNSHSFVTNNLHGLYTTNVFVTVITNNSANVPGIVDSIVMGGWYSDVANGIALDASGNIYVVGSTSSTNYPVTGAVATPRGTNSGNNDVFVTAIKADWSGLLYSTFFGGANNDYGYAIAVDAAGDAYITGETYTGTAGNFPLWNARQTKLFGNSDGFLAKIDAATPAPSLVYSLVKTNFFLSWTSVGYVTPAEFILESNTNLLSTNWITVNNISPTTNTVVSTNVSVSLSTNVYQYTVPWTTNRAKFFRLHSRNF